MSDVIYIRNPYPLPDVVREGLWTKRPVLGKNVSAKDKEWKTKINPHERLFAHHTLNSIRKDCRLIRPQVPNDSLDLALTTVYVHGIDTLIPKYILPVQPETLGKRTWRVLKNKIAISSTPEIPEEEEVEDPMLLFLKKSECDRGPLPERRLHPCNVKLNIIGPHSVQTNPGFSRKIDGTFFSI